MNLIGKTCEVCKEGTYAERSIHDDWDGKLTCDKCNHRIDRNPNKTKTMKFTPENIRNLEPNQVFVFGANERGVHGAGAAKTALRWGAKMGEYGSNGQTYGIPTKDEKIETLPISKIKKHVYDFLVYARLNKDKEFLVTKIGCGLAGLKEEEIAPLFQDVIDQAATNIILPESFHKYLQPIDSIRTIVEIKDDDDCKKIVEKLKFQITSVCLCELPSGFLSLSVDWKAEGENSTAVKYAQQDIQSSSYLLNNWKESSFTIRFSDDLNYTWKTESGEDIEDFFSIDVGLRFNTSFNKQYDYVCFHNTKYGIIAYFAPKGWNYESKIITSWSIYDKENEN